MRVLKRDGTYQDVQFDKITARLRHLSNGLSVDPVLVAQKVCVKLADGIRTSELDEFSAETCMSMYTIHPDYSVLGGRIVVDNHHKTATSTCIADVANQLAHILHPEYIELVNVHKDRYNAMVVHDRDFLLDYFGMKTLTRSYLLKTETKDVIVERPQHMWMRIAIFLHRDDFDRVRETYDLMSTKHFTHASPTLFNAGTKRPQMSSCFVKGTLVNTVNRGSVAVESVREGDLVVTHMARPRRVVQTHANSLDGRKVYKLYVHHTAPIQVTGNHRLYIYNADSMCVGWKSVDELTNRDFVAVPKLESTDTHVDFIGRAIASSGREIPVQPLAVEDGDADFVWMVGVLMASTHVVYSYVYSNVDTDMTGVEMHILDGAVRTRAVNLVKRYFGVDDAFIEFGTRGVVRVTSLLAAIAVRYCLFDNPFETCARDIVQHWLRGFVDGCSVVGHDGDPTAVVVDVSRHSTMYMNRLCTWLKFNQYDISHVRQKRVGNYTMNVVSVSTRYNRVSPPGHAVAGAKLSDQIRVAGGQLFARVHCVSETASNPDQIVYTLGVEDDHSYGIGGIVAENCFLTTVDDSVSGIFKTLTDCAQISKWAGGIGINISDIRGTNSIIRGTNGRTNGILPLLKTYNAVGRYINQSGKRLGSFAMYIEPWHVDIFDFLNAKKSVGSEEERARDLFYGLWIPDLFMDRVKADGVWSLMCPNECQGLTSCYGDAFNTLYMQYETEGRYRKQVKARRVWDAIIELQIESGNPYMVYKDSVNRKSPQENIGVIKQSNLCTEIVLYTDNDHISVCNLASIALPSFVRDDGDSKFDFDALEAVTRVVTRNLNKVIDYNYYPIKEAEHTNKSHRPIGIGVQGLADTFAMLKYPFDSADARELNTRIFECIYYASLSESCLLAQERGAPYDRFEGSPMSRGVLQYDMWGVVPSARYDWTRLKSDIVSHGLLNSTLVSPMPTASTSQILGYNECLPGDTMVTDAHGINHPLVSWSDDAGDLASYSDTMHCGMPSYVTEFMDKGVQPVSKIVLASGQTIESTLSHKFRTMHIPSGKIDWTEAQFITRDHALVMSGIQGIDGTVHGNYRRFDTTLFGDLVPAQCLALARLAGFAMGDGNTIEADSVELKVDTLYDLNTILTDLALVDPSRSYTVMDNDLNFTVTIHKRVVETIQRAFGPLEGLCIPPRLLDPSCPRPVVHAFVAAYCGADGIAPYLAWQDGKPVFDGGYVFRAAQTQSEESRVRVFMTHLASLFNRLDLSTSPKNQQYADDGVAVYSLRVHDMVAFCNCVGYHYSIHKTMRNSLMQLYVNYVSSIRRQWTHVVETVIDRIASTGMDASTALKSAIDAFPDVFIDSQSIPTMDHIDQCLRDGCMVDIQIDANPENILSRFGVLDWIAVNTGVIAKTKLCAPVYHIPVIDTKSSGTKHVYDINVADTHAFVANGIIVHNCIEPFTSNLYARRTLVGEFVCINKHLMRDLAAEGLWTNDIMEQLLYYKGSVQYIPQIPQWIKDVYKTVWEIKQRSLIEMAADRGAFICQSQSLNLFFENPSYKKITAAHFLGWRLGLKTGSYYVRTQSAIDAQNFTIDPVKEKEYMSQKSSATAQATVSCPLRRKGGSIAPVDDLAACEACSG